MKAFPFALALGALVLALPACKTEQSRYTLLDKAYPPKPDNFEVEVFASSPPAREFKRIARLDVHIERTYYVNSGLKDALPELKKQARHAGADAIIDIREKHSSHGETRIYHVTATAIRYPDAG